MSLLADSEIEIVAEASSGPEAVQMAVKHKPDVVLLDIRMPDSDGLDALDKIHHEVPDTKVVDALDLRQSDVRGPGRGPGGQRLRAQGGQSAGPDHHHRGRRRREVAHRTPASCSKWPAR